MAKAKQEVSKSEVSKKTTWAGAQSLLKRPGNEKEAKERELVMMVSWALGVSPFGVNILGSLPYINKLGLSQKAAEYTSNKVQFEYQWVQRALNDTDKAICECRVLDKGVAVTGWITGECSPKTVSMSTLNGYQNHMAQTRARNRAILEAYGVRIHEDMMSRLDKNGISEASKMVALGSTASSSEEVAGTRGKSVIDEPMPEISQQEFDGIKEEVVELNGAADRKSVDATLKKMKVRRLTGEYSTEQLDYLTALAKKVLAKHSGI